MSLTPSPKHRPWITLTLRLDALKLREEEHWSKPSDQPAVIAQLESALFEAGALSVTLLDAEDDPILEPDPGALPLWPHVLLQAIFDDQDIARHTVDTLHALGLIQHPDAIELGQMEDQEWTRAWMDQFVPMAFGNRLWVCPSHLTPDPTWPVVLRLDPGLAFGSGTHPTTALCLSFLDQWAEQRKVSDAPVHTGWVIDFGCGSGILGIAAALLGAHRVMAVDHDPQALVASEENARLNGCLDKIDLYSPDAFFDQGLTVAAEVVVANILAQPLIELAPKLSALVAPGGWLVLSGILSTQAEAVKNAYRCLDPDPVQRSKEDWVCLAFAQKPRS